MVAASKGCFDVAVTFRRALCVILSLAATAGALSCGPSFQAIYEGNARFEHCYALEERQQTPLDEKAECWHDWSQRYTYGQTRDRIHYATARYVALSQTIPTDEAMMMAAPGMTQRTSNITAPAPTNAFAPPPKVLESSDGSAGRPSRPSEIPTIVGTGGSSLDAGPGASPEDGGLSAAPLPGTECAEGCGAKFHACKGAGCEKTYRACMRACMK
jgi:hypothetical protein